jgi:hypothetical protein
MILHPHQRISVILVMLFDAYLDTCLSANGVILESASFIKIFYLPNITWPKSTSLQSNVSQRIVANSYATTCFKNTQL